MTEKPEFDDAESQRLTAWNRRRRLFARKTGLPYVPVESDRDAPPVDEALIRKLIDRKLPMDDAARVFGYCWRYPSWIQAAARLGIERLWTNAPSGEQVPHSPQLE